MSHAEIVSESISKEELNSQIYLENIIERIPYFIFWKNTDSVYLGCNLRFANLVGRNSPNQVIGKTDYDLGWGEGEAEQYIKGDQDVMKGNQKVNVEEILIRPDGSKIVMLVSKVAMRDRYGNCIGVLGTSTDITEIKNIQEAFKQEKEKAELASRAKTEFIANMSHDVKTPLSGIISIAELLSSYVSKEYRDLTQDIFQAGQHLMTFFENCIELSKLEGGSIVLSNETFSLKHLLNEVLHLFRPAIKAKNLALHVDYDEKLSRYFLGNRATLYRILLNLVGNAVKFTPQGSVTIRAEPSKNSTPEKAVIKLLIIDTGVGIPPDKQKLIFERFSRLTPSYQGTYEGSGIGLHIVQELVKAIGGEIHVKSKEGEGSQFTVVFPLQIPLLADGEYEDVADLSLPIPHSDLIQPTFLPEKLMTASEYPAKQSTNAELAQSLINVLLVEDDLMAQKGASLLLSSFRCKVDVASCGREGIALFKPGKYDLIFMDIGLPDMKGYEVARQLRKMEEGTSFKVPIIGLSAHATPDDKRLNAAVGIAETLSKPLLVEQARAVLMQYVPIVQDIINENLLRMENGLRIIDLQMAPGNPTKKEQMDWEMLDNLISSLPESRAELEAAYKIQNIPLLLGKVHKFRGGVCYTKATHLLQAVSTLETSLRNGEHDKLDIFYNDVLKAMEILEKVYQSL